jgi:hypothetical protein
MKDEKALLRVNEFAAVLDVTPACVRRWLHERSLRLELEGWSGYPEMRQCALSSLGSVRRQELTSEHFRYRNPYAGNGFRFLGCSLEEKCEHKRDRAGTNQ